MQRSLTAVVVAVAGLAIAGCQAPAMIREQPSIPFFREAVDACNAQRQPFEQAREQFSQRIWASVGKGALVGGGVGALGAAVLSDGDLKDVVVGMVIGAIIGSVAGAADEYLEQKAEKETNRRDLLNAIENDALSDNQNLMGLTGSLAALNGCRERQIGTLVADAKAGKWEKGKIRQWLAAIEAAIKDDNDLVASVVDEVGERRVIYVEAASATAEVDEAIILGESANYAPDQVEFGTTETLVSRTRSNVRSEPSRDGRVLGVLDTGERVKSFGLTEDEEWRKVEYQGAVAYVYRTLLVPSDNASDESGTVAAAEVPVGDNAIQNLKYQEVTFTAQNDASEKKLLSSVDTARVLLEL